jgi:hypothetical protein
MTVKPTIMMFNKPTEWTIDDWRHSPAYRIMEDCPINHTDNIWVIDYNMTDEEKRKYFISSIDDEEREDIAKANFDYGRAEGEAAKAEAIAKKLLAMGLTLAQVAEGTGLSVEEVEALG